MGALDISNEVSNGGRNVSSALGDFSSNSDDGLGEMDKKKIRMEGEGQESGTKCVSPQHVSDPGPGEICSTLSDSASKLGQ